MFHFNYGCLKLNRIGKECPQCGTLLRTLDGFELHIQRGTHKSEQEIIRKRIRQSFRPTHLRPAPTNLVPAVNIAPLLERPTQKQFYCAHCPFKDKLKERLLFHLMHGCAQLNRTGMPCPKFEKPMTTLKGYEGHVRKCLAHVALTFDMENGQIVLVNKLAKFHIVLIPCEDEGNGNKITQVTVDCVTINPIDSSIEKVTNRQ